VRCLDAFALLLIPGLGELIGVGRHNDFIVAHTDVHRLIGHLRDRPGVPNSMFVGL
jgi:hypothetical protein